MKGFTRRHVIKTAVGSAVAAPALIAAARAWAVDVPFEPESGAELRMLRWKRFVQSEEEAFLKLIDAFTQATGIPVRIDSEGFEDLRPKAAVAASIGSGPDIIWGIHADAHLYPDALVDVSDLCNYLGDKYGGWYPIAEEYGVSPQTGQWINVPFVMSGNFLNYRVSWVQEAGFEGIPGTTDEFLTLMKNLQANGHPGGFALGNASGDGNAWAHWILWSHGGKVVDDDDNVVLNSPETVASLEYVRELAPTFIEGAASWLDGNNNKAFLSGDVSVTNNGISIYAAALREGMTNISDDMDHAFWPVGPSGEVAEFHVAFPMMVYKHSEYPQAAQALITWLLEAGQYSDFLQGSVGYLTQPLRAYDDHPVWAEDPKRAVFKQSSERARSFAHSGTLGLSASSVFADFVVVNMVAEVAVGARTPQEAAENAQRRAERYYII